jgi:hypothetical protein
MHSAYDAYDGEAAVFACAETSEGWLEPNYATDRESRLAFSKVSANHSSEVTPSYPVAE